jgi:hypothetical protein
VPAIRKHERHTLRFEPADIPRKSSSGTSNSTSPGRSLPASDSLEPHRKMNIRRISACLLGVAFSVLAHESSAQPNSSTSAQAQANASRASRLQIKLVLSRSQAVVGGGLGATGIIENVGADSTIYLSTRDVALIAPPEFDRGASLNSSLFAYFPTEPVPQNNSTLIALRPGAQYRVSWVVDPKDSTVWSRLKNEFRYLFFSPGEYEVVVNGKYWTNPLRSSLEYHTYTSGVSVHLSAPQPVLLFGAMIGGLLAYLLFPSRRTRNVIVSEVSEGRSARQLRWRKSIDIGKRMWGLLGAMLWSAIVTILLSRLSETQFLIGVSISDFWGAIAIGFVAQYAGSKWLERLLPDDPKINDSKDSGETASITQVALSQAPVGK